MKIWKSRKSGMKKPEKKKLVRIDHKTWIEVSEDIPDSVAKKKYLEKIPKRP